MLRLELLVERSCRLIDFDAFLGVCIVGAKLDSDSHNSADKCAAD